MISKTDIVAFAKRVTHSQASSSRHSLHPMRDWGIGLVVATLIGISGAFYAGDIFFTQLREAGQLSPTTTDAVEYNEAEVQRVLETYRARADVFGVVPQYTEPLTPANTSQQHTQDEKDTVFQAE